MRGTPGAPAGGVARRGATVGRSGRAVARARGVVGVAAAGAGGAGVGSRVRQSQTMTPARTRESAAKKKVAGESRRGRRGNAGYAALRSVEPRAISRPRSRIGSLSEGDSPGSTSTRSSGESPLPPSTVPEGET